MFNEWKEGTPETWVCFIFSGRTWLLMWNSNKSNIYSKDLPIVMTNRMWFSSSTRYVVYASTTRSPRRTHAKTSMSPLDLDSRINFFHLCSKLSLPLLSMCGTVCISGDISSITAKWGAQLQVNVDSWKVIKISGNGKNRGIVATRNLPKGTIIAMYGSVMFNRKEDKRAVTSHSLDTKDSGKTLAINRYKWNLLPKFARASLANDPDAAGLQNSHVDWMIPCRNYYSKALFRIPILKTTKPISVGEEITVFYSANSYLPTTISC